MIQERYRFHPPGAAFGVALGLGPAGLPYWRDLVPDPDVPLAQWEPVVDWHPYAPDESAAELAVELMRVAGLVKEVPVQHRPFSRLEVVLPPPDPQARATAAALGAVERALGAGKEGA